MYTAVASHVGSSLAIVVRQNAVVLMSGGVANVVSMEAVIA